MNEAVGPELRRGYRCPCDGWDRVTGWRPTPEADRQLERAFEVTGLTPLTCPWWTLRDHYVQAVIIAHRDWVKGAIGPNDVPAQVWDGVHVFESALNTVRAWDWEREKEERERNAPPQGGPNPRRLLAMPPRPPRRRK